jgi:N-methylhydantoinase B/oxoprolinase/acetone carboxylase alpha subunit
MAFVQDHAAELVREATARLGPAPRRFADALDDGTPIVVTLSREGAELAIDFAGTGAEVPGNLNAPRAVTLAAVIYFLRILVNRPIPLNGGFLRAVRVHVPRHSVLAPSPGAAVAGGNVETSQRVVDVLLGAPELAAASQGTMNNLSFRHRRLRLLRDHRGRRRRRTRISGASAVHTHMTNTRITDVEVLESRYPVRVLEMSIRRGSGGAGRFHGGDGVRRSLEFLAPAEVSVLSERRERAPFGLAGGSAGQPGRNLLNGSPIPVRSGSRYARATSSPWRRQAGAASAPPSRRSDGDGATLQRFAHLQRQGAVVHLTVLRGLRHFALHVARRAHRHEVSAGLRAQPEERRPVRELPDPDPREVPDALHALVVRFPGVRKIGGQNPAAGPRREPA